jgi:glycosyltransferase involved in cell wall biosynthesis
MMGEGFYAQSYFENEFMLTISVITAVFNRADTIGQALDSVQAQTWPRVEHVVIDGASTDGTLQVLQAARERLGVLVSEKDNGIYDALNKGLDRATGDVVGLMHSDDFYADDGVLEKVAAAFADPAVDGVYGDLDYVAKEDTSRVIRRWRSGDCSRARLRWGWMPPHPTLFLRRRVIEDFGGFDTSFRIAADYDAVLRYFWRGGIQAAYIPEVLVKMRVGGESNRSLSRILRKSREDLRALRKNGVGGVETLVWKNLSKVGQFF